MRGFYLYTFRNIFVQNITFSKLVLQITFDLVDLKPISLKKNLPLFYIIF